MNKRPVRARGNELMFLAVLTAALLASLGLGPIAFAVEVDDQGIWESWSSESYTMDPKESFQLRLDYDLMPTRRWLLVVDGGDQNCDLSVLRVNGEELLYYKIDESRHEVSIPWGKGEELIIVLTNRDYKGAFVVDLMGPPRDQNQASYSYPLNRALEAYASGQRLKAQDLCRDALREDPDDDVAKVLLAGFLRESNSYSEAQGLVNEALKGDLPPAMRTLAENLEKELKTLRAPLPKAVQDGLSQAEKHLQAGEPSEALTACENLLEGGIKLSSNSRARILILKGRSLEALGRNFEAVDSFTQALNYDRAKAAQAVAYYHMGGLFLKMGNLAQSEGAYTIALQNGLPTGLDVQARENLKIVQDRLNSDR